MFRALCRIERPRIEVGSPSPPLRPSAREPGRRLGLMAEARAAELVRAWDAALPGLKLEALLQRI